MCLYMICTIFHGLWYLVPLKNPLIHTSVAILHLTCYLVLALFGPLLLTFRLFLAVQGWTVPALPGTK
jgi:hypothetical protein